MLKNKLFKNKLAYIRGTATIRTERSVCISLITKLCVTATYIFSKLNLIIYKPWQLAVFVSSATLAVYVFLPVIGSGTEFGLLRSTRMDRGSATRLFRNSKPVPSCTGEIEFILSKGVPQIERRSNDFPFSQRGVYGVFIDCMYLPAAVCPCTQRIYVAVKRVSIIFLFILSCGTSLYEMVRCCRRWYGIK